MRGQSGKMSILPRYFRNLDKTAVRAILVSLGLFTIVALIFLEGKFGDFIDFDAMQNALQSFADSPWGVPFLIAMFCISAFLGAPQFALIAGAVVAFGPVWGALWSWVATLCSGAVTFWTGRLMGEATFRKYGGNFAGRLSAFINKNVFAASAIVRSVPTGPFILVNMAFGVVGASFLAFWAGMALGVWPKIILVVLISQGFVDAATGSFITAGIAIIAAIGVWIAIMLFARGRMTTTRQAVSPEGELAVDTPGNRAEN